MTAWFNVLKILQLVKIKDILIDFGLCYFHGMMEYWNTGILVVRAEINHFNCKKLLHPIIPLLHHFNIPIVSEAN
ncbi:MAG: hypothetical protein SRB2_01535 [Desulfobacteraceae bacterium Eth-SRB2]|nr:MAG: hypothetical protein SRB2_01535 [Desulfobacteraceae bacterium Eth-SRB2]